MSARFYPRDPSAREDLPHPTPDSATDLSQWRLIVDDGRQWWKYLTQPSGTVDAPLSDCDRHHLSLLSKNDGALSPPTTVSDSVRNAFRYLSRIQTEGGQWAAEYGGPMFLIPGFVFSWYITGRRTDILPDCVRIELVRYLRNCESPISGGWGIHTESPSTVFGTALNYVALRLLGVSASDPLAERARTWLHTKTQHGVLGIPSWGKFWLATLGLYSWDGIIPIPPEFWLLPDWFPAHPSRMWVHTRMVYLPMSYIYAQRLQYRGDALIDQLKTELYPNTQFDYMDWSGLAFVIDDMDRYAPKSRIGQFIWQVVGVFEKFHSSHLRRRAINHCLKLIENEDDNTMSLDIGPVNKAIHLLAIYYSHGPDSQRFKDHAGTVKDFLWMSRDGMMINGTNGSQLWDTAFICQAGHEAKLHTDQEFRPMFEKALDFLDACQIRQNAPFHTYRHICKGAWPFSNRQQSYTVSDATAEGLKAVLQLQSSFKSKKVSTERLHDAVDVLLSMQNSGGGFASYELIRGPKLLELLNPAEVFGNIMVEYTYPECTTSVVLGLLAYHKYVGDQYRALEVSTVVENALKYIIGAQERETGGWYGSWGICYTYATWFAIESLADAGALTYDSSPLVKRACDFIASKQMSDGGWGESYKSCETHTYVNHATSQVVHTSWALLILMRAKYPVVDVIRRGIELILTRQLPNGSWCQEAIEGVFNKNCMISYPNYKLYFTAWALARFANIYGNPQIIPESDGSVRVESSAELMGKTRYHDSWIEETPVLNSAL